MPDYKRKHRSRFAAQPKADKHKMAPKKNKIKYDEDEPTPRKKGNFTLLKGKKAEIRKRWQVILAGVLVVILAITICQIAIPAGIPETLSTTVSAMGTGEFPIEFESTNTNNVVAKQGYFYVLTDSEIKAVSNGGKVIFTYNHGFENPVIKTSNTRAIVFNQGGNDALIFSLKKLESAITLEDEIINAAIGDNGTYALVTTAKGYVAKVSVYKKSDKPVYEWFSANDMINNVAVARNGKKIAISTLSAKVGGFDSKLMILNFKSANAEFEKQYNGELIYNLSTSFSGGVAVATSNTFDFVRWYKFKCETNKNDYNLQMLRESNKGTLLLYNRENDKTDNRIIVTNKSGKKKLEVKFNGIITDIAFKNNHIYLISDTKAYILDSKGEIVRTADCGFGAVRLVVVSQNEISVISDNQISKVKFSQR
ncbi:MAG: hypothetical protein IKV81_05520 [Clostridia bacterium]|nr:hypothetical protein [Clostridia bacterium]